WDLFDHALEQVNLADGKVMLATLANFASQLAVGQGETARGKVLATRALAAAVAVKQRSQEAIARSTLVRLGEPGQNPRREELQREPELSAFARAALNSAGVSPPLVSPAVP